MVVTVVPYLATFALAIAHLPNRAISSTNCAICRTYSPSLRDTHSSGMESIVSDAVSSRRMSWVVSAEEGWMRMLVKSEIAAVAA